MSVIEEIKRRSEDVDRWITLMVDEGNVSIESIYNLPYPKRVIDNRLTCLKEGGVVEVNQGQVRRGSRFGRYQRELERLPLNANDLELSVRDKLVVLALKYMDIATVNDIHDYFRRGGDTVTKSNLRIILLKLKDRNIVESFKVRGVKSKYYKLVDKLKLFIPESEAELFNEIQNL